MSAQQVQRHDQVGWSIALSRLVPPAGLVKQAQQPFLKGVCLLEVGVQAQKDGSHDQPLVRLPHIFLQPCSLSELVHFLSGYN
jgi:hypothetical protein